jgi:hypothetical protein
MAPRIVPTMRCKLCKKPISLEYGVASCVNMGCSLHGERQ